MLFECFHFQVCPTVGIPLQSLEGTIILKSSQFQNKKVENVQVLNLPPEFSCLFLKTNYFLFSYFPNTSFPLHTLCERHSQGKSDQLNWLYRETIKFVNYIKYYQIVKNEKHGEKYFSHLLITVALELLATVLSKNSDSNVIVSWLLSL